MVMVGSLALDQLNQGLMINGQISHGRSNTFSPSGLALNTMIFTTWHSPTTIQLPSAGGIGLLALTPNIGNIGRRSRLPKLQ